jgi:hypothetical protein
MMLFAVIIDSFFTSFPAITFAWILVGIVKLKESLRNASGEILVLIDPPDLNKLNINLAKQKIMEQKVILDTPRIELGNSGNLSRLKSDFIAKSKLVRD